MDPVAELAPQNMISSRASSILLSRASVCRRFSVENRTLTSSHKRGEGVHDMQVVRWEHDALENEPVIWGVMKCRLDSTTEAVKLYLNSADQRPNNRTVLGYVALNR